MKLSKKKAIEILDILKEEYPEAECALEHRNLYELIVCVVLSAQTTDKSVNKVTHGRINNLGDPSFDGKFVRDEGEKLHNQGLFDLYPSPADLAKAEQTDVMEIIKTIGMYKTKAKNITKLADVLEKKYDGNVPDDFDKLVELPGVGRKTANVVLAVGFGQPRIAVDTHVFRVSHRIGLALSGGSSGEDISAKTAGEKNLLATEEELMKILPRERWSEAHHSLIFHGRNCCKAKNPACDKCRIAHICEYNKGKNCKR